MPPENDEVRVRPAGEGHSRVPGRIPATAAGYLAVLDQGRDHWAFDFNSYGGGKVSELSPFDSTCRPSPLFVTRSEFIAFGCHGGRTSKVIGAFNLRGEEMWEQNLFDPYVAPSAVSAPASGRFALSRLISRGSGGLDLPMPELFGPQSIVVYQIDSGKQLLHVEALPMQRAGQNFTLSPDGLSLAVVHTDEIDIYSLPPLTPKDQAAVKEAQAMAPPETDAAVSFSRSVAAPSPSESAAPTPGYQTPGSPSPGSALNQVDTGSASNSTPPNPGNQPSTTPQADPPSVRTDSSAAQPELKTRKQPSLYAPEAPHPDAPPSEPPQ